MPHGYFTVEKWMPPAKGKGGQWIAVLHLDAYQSLTKAIAALQQRGQTGLYRITQMQRCIWAEMKNGQLRLHGSHASSPEGLARLVEIYEREGGRRRVEKARQDRAKAKSRRSNNRRNQQ
jgi:hypothetical protein